MKLSITPFTVHKRFALRISRGISSENTNLWLRIAEDGIEGWGEVSPFSVVVGVERDETVLLPEFESIADELARFHPLQRQQIEQFLQEKAVSSALRAAIDVALHDWLGKKAGLPLWKLWGLDRDRISPISVTIGIDTPERARERLRHWQETVDVAVIKVKLGSPEGIEADKAMFSAIRAENGRAHD